MKLKKTLFFIYGIVAFQWAFSQTSSRVLSKIETQQISSEIENIPYPIYKVYEYKDKGGVYEVFLCEDQARIVQSDSLNTKIMAMCVLNDHGGFVEKWRIKDELIAKNREGYPETSIWFWSKYASFKDIDGDGRIEPIIVYGSKDENEEYSRVKILTFYKNKKYAMRSEECVLDYCREFQKDEAIKTLPKKIQQFLNQLLDKMRKEQGVLLKNV